MPDLISPADDGQTSALTARVQAMRPWIDALCRQDGVIAVGSLGGLHISRWRPVDRLSDVDITVLLDLDLKPAMLALPWDEFICQVQPVLPRWLPNFKFCSPVDQLEVNVHQQILGYERQSHRVWDDLKCGIYVDGLSVLFDPDGALADLVRQKTSHFPARCRSWLLRVGTYGRNLVDDAVPKCVRRGEMAAAWDLLHDVAGDVMVASFFALGRWPPHPKWRFAQLRSLGLTRPIVAELVELLTSVRMCGTSLDQAKAALGRCIDIILDLGHSYLPPGRTDLYGYALTHYFEDRQLRESTAADAAIGPHRPYAQRMKDPQWNRVNFELPSVNS
ncbi:MAG TPA: hypothetical protein VFQ44_04255 [Streptosporangiaceae bacterium]|nr:hypothetical protein [Streptosporangiaceae bacterium]